jgi:hypothetical protein
MKIAALVVFAFLRKYLNMPAVDQKRLKEIGYRKEIVMNKMIAAVAALLTAAGAAQAVQMSYFDNGAGTVVQTYDSGEFQPGVPSVIPITFRQFDDYDGRATLVSVTVTVTQYAWGGFYAVDNDGATEAVVTVQHGAVGSINETAGYEYFLPTGSQAALSTIVTDVDRVLSANDGDPIEYQEGGTDHFRLNGPDSDNKLSANANDTRTDQLAAYIGDSNLSMDYTVSQSSTHTGSGAVYYSGGPAWSHAIITVTYDYVPEPTGAALLAIGCVALALRRRNRPAVKA